VAERLLLAYAIDTLLTAADSEGLTEVHMLGVARLFGGWNFGQKRRVDRLRCPESLCRRMAEVVARQGIPDNIKRFHHAFYPSKPSS
jgi:hypothetical protein